MAIAYNASLSEIGGGVFLFLAGNASVIASVPVLIISGTNKRKASAILETGKIGIGDMQFSNSSYMSVGLKINF